MGEPNWLDYVAAGATALSAGVIAWQAWQTRAAVKASEANVEAAQRSVEVASLALRESQLARLEAGVPRITVSAGHWVSLSDAMVSIATEAQPYATKQVEWSDNFKLPRDASRTISVSHSLHVRNDGPGAVNVSVSPSAMIEKNASEVIAPGEVREYALSIRKSVQDWIGLLEPGDEDPADKHGRAESHRAKVTYVGPRDADVTEVHEIVFYGSVLRPVKDAVGDWEIDTTGWDYDMTAVVLPAIRTYWRSRSRGEKF